MPYLFSARAAAGLWSAKPLTHFHGSPPPRLLHPFHTWPSFAPPQTEDSRARHFRFRKHRTELSWSTLHAVDVDSLVSRVDVSALEGLLPNLTYGSILAEDEAQLTPHHFGQLVPLGQAALDYVLWQANATGALLVRRREEGVRRRTAVTGCGIAQWCYGRGAAGGGAGTVCGGGGGAYGITR